MGRSGPRFCVLLAAVAAAQPGYAAARTGSDVRRLQFQSSFTAETPQETQVIPTSAPGSSMGMFTTPTGSQMTMTQASTDMVSGMVQSFLHSEPLQAGELDCISQGTGNIAGDLMSVTSQMVSVANQVMGGENGIGEMPGSSSSASAAAGAAPAAVSSDTQLGDGAGDIAAMVNNIAGSQGASTASTAPSSSGAFGSAPSMAAPAPAPAATPAPSPQQDAAQQQETANSMSMFYGSRRLQSVGPESSSTGVSPALAMSAPALMMQFGFNMKQIMSLSKQMVSECVHGDALTALDTASQHMQSLSYVSGHFMANGQDVISELSAAVLAWKQGDPKGFGTNFGMAARKVLLSDAGANGLPEGLPRKEVMANVSAGMIQGMFGRGTTMDVMVPGDVDHAPEDIHVDLHQCVNDNLPFFQQTWAETMWFFAKRHANVINQTEKMQWGTAVAFTMFQAPKALQKCGISEEQEDMLMDGIKGMSLTEGTGGVDVDVDLPPAQSMSTDEAVTNMANATKAWADRNWYEFGRDLGKMVEKAAATQFEQKYYIGADGGLKKRILNLNSRGQVFGGGASMLAVVGMALLAATPVIGAAGLRLHRAWRNSASDGSVPLFLQTEDDVESGNEAAVE